MTLEEYLKSGSCSLLENILNELKKMLTMTNGL